MDEIEGGLGDDGEGNSEEENEDDEESEESEESECEDEVYACQDAKFFEDENACVDGCEDWSETARSLWTRYQDLTVLDKIEAELDADVKHEGTWELDYNSGDGQQIPVTINVNLSKYASYRTEKLIASDYLIHWIETTDMSSEIEIDVSD